MEDVKLADIEGTKKEYMQATIDELETNSTIKYIRDWYSGISYFKKGY